MQCYRCNTPVPDESRFCISCGADLSDPSGAGSSTAAMDAAKAEQLLRLVRQEVGSEFEVERELGRGGMAIVYLATEVHLGRKVAIKVLPPELTFGTDAADRFKREARTAATLDHPNIIPIYRVAPGGRLFWYAMKFLEGRSLADLLDEKKRLPLHDTMSILDQVASALDYAHKRNVIHRDIKPANVMLDAHGRVIVTDFGIAKQLAAGSFTSSGSVIGTPYYMSPEQCRGAKTLTGAADQYSVGVMAYQMLSGQVPFEGESAIDILTRHCMQPPPPLAVLRPGLPQHVYQAIEKALAKKPDGRFPTVGAFVEVLKRRSAAPTTTAPRRTSFWHRISTTAIAVPARRRAWVAGLTLAGIGGVVGTWVWVSQQRLEPPPASEKTADSLLAVQTPTGGAADTTARTTATRPPSDSQPAATRPAPTQVLPPAPTERPATGRLRLAGVPADASVYVDRQRRTGTSLTLAAGQHIVLIEAPGFTPTTDTVTLGANATRELQYAGQPIEAVPEPPPEVSVLVIRTEGGWARIYVDNALRREGTSHRDTVPPGTHTLRFERDGYEPIDTTVTLRAGETRLVTVTMRPQRP